MDTKGYLIYNTYDYEKNKWFANELVKEAKKVQISLSIIFAQDIALCLSGKEFSVVHSGKILDKVDIVINRTRSSLIGRHFELIGCKVLNSSEVTEICNNKARTHQEVNSLGIKSVNMLMWSKHSDVKWKDSIKYPFIAKSLGGHGGDEVYKINDEDEFDKCVDNTKEETILLQEICETPGIDIRVFIIGGEVKECVRRYSNKSFKSNFSLGGSSEPYQLSSKQFKIVNKILDRFKLDFAGIDFIVGANNELLFNEIEDVVGCRTLYQNYNINVAKEYIHYIKSLI